MPQTNDFKYALSVGRAVNLHLPDSKTVEDAYLRVASASQPWLFHHVVRSWLYGFRLAHLRNMHPDQEVLAVSVLLHDLGLCDGVSLTRRFEVVGADLGRDFAISHGLTEHQSETIWDSIALHTTPTIAQHRGVNVACCQLGIACDYSGLGYDLLQERERRAVLEAYPRLQMKGQLSNCLAHIATNHPETARDNFLADFGQDFVPNFRRFSFVEALHKSPFSE